MRPLVVDLFVQKFVSGAKITREVSMYTIFVVGSQGYCFEFRLLWLQIITVNYNIFSESQSLTPVMRDLTLAFYVRELRECRIQLNMQAKPRFAWLGFATQNKFCVSDLIRYNPGSNDIIYVAIDWLRKLIQPLTDVD